MNTVTLPDGRLRTIVEEAAFDLGWRGVDDPCDQHSWLDANAPGYADAVFSEMNELADWLVDDDRVDFDDWAEALDDQNAPEDPDEREGWIQEQVRDLLWDSACTEADDQVTRAVEMVFDEAYERGREARDEDGGPEWEEVDPEWRDLLRPYGVTAAAAATWVRIFEDETELAEELLEAGCPEPDLALAAWTNRSWWVETPAEALELWRLEREATTKEFTEHLLGLDSPPVS